MQQESEMGPNTSQGDDSGVTEQAATLHLFHANHHLTNALYRSWSQHVLL